MTVSYAIMAHPSRAAWVDELLEQMGDTPVAWAKPPWATPKHHEPIWRTKREALQTHGDTDYHCVIQDDAILCHGFKDRVEALEPGDRVTNLFYRDKRAYREAARMARLGYDRGYFTAPVTKYTPLGVGVMVPTHHIRDLIAYCDEVDDRGGDDPRMKKWMRARGIELFVPLPSLVDHRISKSLIGHPIQRKAWRFAR